MDSIPFNTYTYMTNETYLSDVHFEFTSCISNALITNPLSFTYISNANGALNYVGGASVLLDDDMVELSLVSDVISLYSNSTYISSPSCYFRFTLSTYTDTVS